MIAWLLALPIAVALVMILLGRWPLVSAPLTSVTLVAMMLLALGASGDQMLILGRALVLSPEKSQLLALCLLLVALVVFVSHRFGAPPSIYSLTLGTSAFLCASAMMRNAALATLLLAIGVVLGVMLVPASRRRPPGIDMRVLVLLCLAIPLLLVSAWASEPPGEPEEMARLQVIGEATFALGCALLLGAAPFHLWVSPVFKHGTAIGAVVLTVFLRIVVLLRIVDMLALADWPAEQAFLPWLLMVGGVATGVVGCVASVVQGSLGGVVAYASLADLGLVLATMGTGSTEGVRAATFHLLHQSVAVTLLAMGLGGLRLCVDQMRVSEFGGLARRAPLAIVAMILGGLSLAGFPPWAGFTSRFALYRLLAIENLGYALLLAGLSFCPAWAFFRFFLEAVRPLAVPDLRREPRVWMLVTLPLVAFVCIPALLIGAAERITSEWLPYLFGG